MSFIPDSGIVQLQTVTPPIRQYIRTEATGARDSSGRTWQARPIARGKAPRGPGMLVVQRPIGAAETGQG